MAEFVDNDEQIKEDEDLKQDEDDTCDVQNHDKWRSLVILFTRTFKTFSFKRFNALTLQCFNTLFCFLAGPLIGTQYDIEIGIRNAGMSIHHVFHYFPDLWESPLPVQECCPRHFVRGIENRRQCSTRFPCFARQI